MKYRFWVAATALATTSLVGLTAYAQEFLAVRGADHAGFSRLVFDLAQQTSYRVHASERALIIEFDTSSMPPLSDELFSKLSRIEGARADSKGDKVEVTLALGQEARFHHFRNGNSIAVDIRDAAPVLSDELQVQATARSLQLAVQAMNDADKARVESQALARAEERKATLEAARKVLKKNIAPEEAVTQSIKVMDDGDKTIIQFPLDAAPALAAFQRGQYIWIVFDRIYPWTLADLEHVAHQKIEDLSQAERSVYRIGVNDMVRAHVLEGDEAIQLVLSQTPMRPDNPIEINQHHDEEEKPKTFLKLDGESIVVTLADAEVGDELNVILSPVTGQGNYEALANTNFNILSSAQGAAIESLSDGLVVAVVQGGVQITVETPADLFSANDLEPPHLYLNFDDWKLYGAGQTYVEKHKSLLSTLARATPDDRAPHRWRMARFYAAYGQYGAAFGVLKLMEEEDQALNKDADFRALRGVVSLNMRRFEKAHDDLSFEDLRDEPDASLWRALLFHAEGEQAKALNAYKKGVSALVHYKVDDRAKFALTAAQAALVLGEYRFVEKEIAAVKAIRLSPLRRAQARYLEAQLSDIYSDNEGALEAYDALVVTAPRPVAAQAQFAKIRLQHKMGRLDAIEAISALEGLRYAWRGDNFEIELLRELGRLHIANNDYRASLETLRQAVSYFKKSDATKAVTRQMEDIFQDLFLAGRADALEPLKAVALYYDFRELTPLGNDGDTMVRRLADRMVSVDLLDRAAGLLEHQIKYRLEGVAQASVAAKLAAILIQDLRAEEAIDIIRATRNIVDMPPDLRNERSRLEARALIDLARYNEAEAVLEDDRSREAELLRADLYWGSKRWSDIVANSNTLLGNRWQDSRALDLDEQRHLLRTAVALTMLEREEELEKINSRFGLAMKAGPYGNAFAVITGSGAASPANLRAAVSNLAEVNRLESFMDKYRQGRVEDDKSL